ncbi:hypothetical protein HO133_005828 [Letharia lupina]|uniref:Uncharacterized protein n=1 Tax=Letharia lupina TaxID=560253 RepID=A0A8H6F8F4_9LECA|nr:uncharacterized protein HO133_005828 [Letharia lupina]KAF6218479.1 hypothetical protein HO133_005828 [Letharia lupina]
MPLKDDDGIAPPVPASIRAGRVPPPSSQGIFFLTGALAGATTIPIESLWQRLVLRAPGSLPLLGWAPIYRGGVRFWTFDLARYRVERLPIPVAIKGGLSGAAGGLAEVCVQSLFRNKLPDMASLTSQSGKMFCCFGTYTFLSTTLSPEQLPPKPFWYCWLIGATAGGLGSGIIARAEGVTGSALWRVAVPKGALTIGTVIAVQVTTCAVILPYNRFIPNGRL